MQKVSVQSPGCWIWTAGTTGKTGYGAFHDGTRSITAHKFVYELLVGPTPDGMELDHLCRVRLCCNPDHLEPVTHAVNTARGIVGMTVVNDPEYRAKRAAYMRDYMAKRRAAEATQTG